MNVERTSTGSALGFFPVPALDPRQPSTSFKVRGREMRVDFLTPLHGPDHPHCFLDDLIERPAQAVLLAGSGILVNVPDPARFAFHKLWIAKRRAVSEQTKAAKDLRQAGDLLELLLEDRPGDLLVAWEALSRHPALRQGVAAAMRGLVPELRERVAVVLGRAG